MRTRHEQQPWQRISNGEPTNVSEIALPFETADIGAEITSRGFDVRRRAVFVWEAVAQHLDPRGFPRWRRSVPWRSRVRGVPRERAIRKFGRQPANVREFGSVEREQLGRADYARRYLEPAGRHLSVTEIKRSVSARIANFRRSC